MAKINKSLNRPGGGGRGAGGVNYFKKIKPAIKKSVAKSVEKKSLKAANTLAKGNKAAAARARGEKYQDFVDSNLSIKDKGVRQRYQTTLARKKPGWIGGNSYIKPPKK